MLADRMRMSVGVSGDDPLGIGGLYNLIAGDMDAGFFGEVPTSELINGRDLMDSFDLYNRNRIQNENEPWLKFAYERKIQFVAKKPYLHTTPWRDLDNAGIVFGREITVRGMRFLVRLMRGASVNPALSGVDLQYSEWNKLMLPIHEKSIDKSWSRPGNVEDDVPIWQHGFGSGVNGMYTDVDLVTHRSGGYGHQTLCQETSSSSSSNRLTRGGASVGVSTSSMVGMTSTSNSNGWRPILELVQ